MLFCFFVLSMKTKNTIFLSIGTNEGNRIENLQNSINQIDSNIGTITQISSIYKTPSWGFIGNDFYNICIEVITLLDAKDLLKNILAIEIELGRQKKIKEGYENRIIDIDILLFNTNIISSKNLIVPHQKMLDRNFVLVPLAEIASNIIHPTKNDKIATCLQNCVDTSQITKITDKLKKPISIADKYNYITIEGNIGAGKTSLTQMLANELNATELLEEFAENPFLSKFYEDKKRYAFQVETSFLMARHQQLSAVLNKPEMNSNLIISDYNRFKSLIFSKINLTQQEYALYSKIFNAIYSQIKKPDLHIYLHQNNERLLENIKKRGRSYEQNIKTSYLDEIQKGYETFFNRNFTPKTVYIDASKLDFINKNKDYRHIINKIKLF